MEYCFVHKKEASSRDVSSDWWESIIHIEAGLPPVPPTYEDYSLVEEGQAYPPLVLGHCLVLENGGSESSAGLEPPFFRKCAVPVKRHSGRGCDSWVDLEASVRRRDYFLGFLILMVSLLAIGVSLGFALGILPRYRTAGLDCEILIAVFSGLLGFFGFLFGSIQMALNQ